MAVKGEVFKSVTSQLFSSAALSLEFNGAYHCHKKFGPSGRAHLCSIEVIEPVVRCLTRWMVLHMSL